MNMSNQDLIVHSTVRIEAVSQDGSGWSGTGFYMHLLKDVHGAGYATPVIITNKHVVDSAHSIYINMTFAKEDGSPNYQNHQRYCIEDVQSLCVRHPDPNVDLAAIIIAGWLQELESKPVGKLFYCPLTVEIIPNEEERKSLSSIEDILMIGYPDSTWDYINNLPVVRKGITATHPYLPWQGKSVFLTDVASFSGSSGSPVFLFNNMGYLDRSSNSYIMDSRLKLLGIHYGGTTHNAPLNANSNTSNGFVQIPNNIGAVVNSKEILTLEEEIRRMISA